MMKAYAYKNTEAIVRKSSSGGAFTGIIEALYAKYDAELYVYGAAWDANMQVRHMCASNLGECEIFNGSKYVRSHIDNTFEEIRGHLDKGEYVVFTGTPCQVYALKSKLGIQNAKMDKLICLDVICHGTPNAELWSDYVKWLEKKYNSRLVSFTFRDKSKGWKGYRTRAVFEDGIILDNNYEMRVYIGMFFSLLSINQGCFKCKFKTLDREGDITMGDFWGIEKILPAVEPGYGVSLVLANTLLGEEIVDSLNGKEGQLLVPYNGDKYMEYQDNLFHCYQKPDKYKAFWNDYTTKGFTYVIQKYGFYTEIGRLRYTLGTIKRLLMSKFLYSHH